MEERLASSDVPQRRCPEQSAVLNSLAEIGAVGTAQSEIKPIRVPIRQLSHWQSHSPPHQSCPEFAHGPSKRPCHHLGWALVPFGHESLAGEPLRNLRNRRRAGWRRLLPCWCLLQALKAPPEGPVASYHRVRPTPRSCTDEGQRLFIGFSDRADQRRRIGAALHYGANRLDREEHFRSPELRILHVVGNLAVPVFQPPP